MFTAAQIEAMLDAAQHDMHTSYRNRAIILLLLDTGLRVSELCGLDLEDVNFESGIIKVLGKGARERHVPIGSGVQRCLWRYVTQYRQEPHPSAGKALFLTAMRFRMTKSAVEIFIRKCWCAAGITGVRCSPHTFRHTFALSYLRNGGDVF